MLIISLAFSLFYLIGACLAYPRAVRAGGRLTVFLVCGFLAVVFSVAVSLPLLVTALVLIVAGLVCRGLKVRPGGFSWAAVACTLLVYGGFALGQLPSFLERRNIRERYPIESLSRRLEYEGRAIAQLPERMRLRAEFPMESMSERLSYQARAGRNESDASAKTELESSVASAADPRRFEIKLNELEQQLEQASWQRWRDRSEALRQIHSSYVQQFMDSPGFGVSRMAPMTEPEKYVPIDEPQTIPLLAGEMVDWDATPPQNATSRQLADGDTRQPSAPTGDQLRFMYESGLTDFVNRRGWGYVQDRDHVAGFQSHHFRQTPELSDSDRPHLDSGFNAYDASEVRASNRPRPNAAAERPWQVRRLELVSLLRHDEACVYVSDSLPRMDKVAEYEVRPLNGFEAAALRSLEAGEDVVSDSTNTNRIRMFGAIRAAKQCLKCHSVERGELLGAFSYDLDRSSPVRERRKPAEPAF